MTRLVDNLNPNPSFAKGTGDCRLVVSPHACFQALPCARCPVRLVGLEIRTAGSDCPSPLSELMSQHGCHFRFDGS